MPWSVHRRGERGTRRKAKKNWKLIFILLPPFTMSSAIRQVAKHIPLIKFPVRRKVKFNGQSGTTSSFSSFSSSSSSSLPTTGTSLFLSYPCYTDQYWESRSVKVRMKRVGKAKKEKKKKIFFSFFFPSLHLLLLTSWSRTQCTGYSCGE